MITQKKFKYYKEKRSKIFHLKILILKSFTDDAEDIIAEEMVIETVKWIFDEMPKENEDFVCTNDFINNVRRSAHYYKIKEILARVKAGNVL